MNPESSLGKDVRQDGEPSAKQAINTNARLFDLVRFMRSELHRANLITDEEYAWLLSEAPMANSKQGGSPSPRRLEDYDELEAKLTAAEKERDAAVTEKMEALVARDFADLAHDRAEARAASVERVAGELAEALEQMLDDSGAHHPRGQAALAAYKALQPGREKALGNDVRTT